MRMTTLKSFLSSSLFTSLVMVKLRGVALVAKFALTLFIAHFLGFEVLGLYGLIGAGCIVLPAILGLSLMFGISRHAVTQTLEEITESISQYLRFIGLLYIFILLVTLVIIATTHQVVMPCMAFIILLLGHLNQDFYNLLLNISKPFIANLLFFVRTAFWMILYMILAYLFPPLRNLNYLLTSWAIGEGLSLLGFCYVTRQWPWLVSTSAISLIEWLRSELKQTRIIYFNSIATTISEYLDRYLVTLMLGLEYTGVYILFWSIGSALTNLVRTGVIQFFRPKLVRAAKDKAPEYATLFFKCLKDTIASSTVLAFVAGISLYFVMPYLQKPLAMDWLPVMGVILVAFVVGMVKEVYGLVFYSFHRDDLTFETSLYLAACSITLNLLLIPLIGLWGAGIALVLSNVLAIFVQHKKVSKMDFYQLAKSSKSF